MTWLSKTPRVQVERVLNALEELGDIEIQRRRWNWNAQREMSSFVEAVEGLFDDSGLGDELEKGRSGLTMPTIAAIETLDVALANIEVNRTPDEIIADDKMHEVRARALEALRLMKRELANER